MWLAEDDWQAERDGARFMGRTAADSTPLSYEHNGEQKHPDHADVWGNVLTQTVPQREEPVRHAAGRRTDLIWLTGSGPATSGSAPS